MKRYLAERDKARDDGDKLATSVRAFLRGKADETQLALALMTYCESQGWHGPACTMVHDIIDHEKDCHEEVCK